jgi:hypothetical protein
MGASVSPCPPARPVQRRDTPHVWRSRGARHGGTGRQGLTLVHLSARPESFLSLWHTDNTRRVIEEVLTLSRKVDECKPLLGGMPPHRGTRAEVTASPSADEILSGDPDHEAGAQSGPLFSSTLAVLVIEPFRVLFVMSSDPRIYWRYPTYPTQSAYVELRSGRV